MKYVRSLQASPPLLEAYVVANPQVVNHSGNTGGAVWKLFKETADPAYMELLKVLVERQQGLCIYCEQRLVKNADDWQDEQPGPEEPANAQVAAGRFRENLVPLDYQVEHVVPKTVGMGRALDWTNLTLACCGGSWRYHKDQSRTADGPNQTCGQSKGNKALPTNGDPRAHVLLQPYLEVDINGTVLANATNCFAAGVAAADIDDTISVLNLNCERLRVARQNSYANVTRLLVALLGKAMGDPNIEADLYQELIPIRLQPDRHGCLIAWWSTERAALGAGVHAWLHTNQRSFL